MRIIGGHHRGLRLNPPPNLPVRPTTDMAKEALFNILQNLLGFEGLRALDLFAGTGNISVELASRGAVSVKAVDQHFGCVRYINDTAKKHGIGAIQATKENAFEYINRCADRFDFIFADPPYDLPQLPQLPKVIFDKGLLDVGGLLVVEHPSMRMMEDHPAFIQTRKYGYSSFTFYRYG